MINRDFTRSGKEYVKKNKFVLIALALILAMGIVMLCVFGFKGGSDVAGYNTFSIKMGNEYEADELKDYTQNINIVLAENDANLHSVQLTGEGDYTTLVVKYSGNIDDINKFNVELANELDVNVNIISEHYKVEASITSRDYIYAVACGLVIITIAVIYMAFRHNLACTITALIGSILGVALLMALVLIFRLTVNSSFLAINILTILLILGESLILFDGLDKERANLKDKNDRNNQLSNTLKANALRQKIMYGSLFAMALVFVILMPNVIKQASVLVLFATVVAMFITVYALPFFWCLTITQVSDKIRVKKVEKTKVVQSTEDVEGELENKYTENQVIEVKEDSGDDTPSSDDNITIE